MIDHQRNLDWSSLDELFASENMLWFISLDAENWINGKCSCPYFQKNYKCKHLLGLSHSKGLDGADISDAPNKYLSIKSVHAVAQKKQNLHFQGIMQTMEINSLIYYSYSYTLI